LPAFLLNYIASADHLRRNPNALQLKIVLKLNTGINLTPDIPGHLRSRAIQRKL
jgi:hypothetical protein